MGGRGSIVNIQIHRRDERANDAGIRPVNIARGCTLLEVAAK